MYEDLSHAEKIDLYNDLTEQRWKLTEALHEVDLGRAAVMSALRTEPDSVIIKSS